MNRAPSPAWLLLTLAACVGPVEQSLIDSLGPEVDGVPEGEFHRPGQPCLACHGREVGDGPVMAVAGTIYATPTDPVPVEGVNVRITDARGETRTPRTNCAGNFFVEESDWQPVFPLSVSISCPQVPPPKSMGSPINRDGSCATCHAGPASLDSPGWVYCASAMPDPPYSVDPSCPGVAP